MLTISRLSKSYGEKTALKNLDLTVQEGALFGLMGQNGAGKTTLLKITAGLLLPDSGSIEIDGVDALSKPRNVRHKIGYVPDDFGRYENLRVSEHIQLGRVLELGDELRIEVVIRFDKVASDIHFCIS